ncbi:hypothetical protein [Persephonella sp.]
MKDITKDFLKFVEKKVGKKKAKSLKEKMSMVGCIVYTLEGFDGEVFQRVSLGKDDKLIIEFSKICEKQ